MALSYSIWQAKYKGRWGREILSAAYAEYKHTGSLPPHLEQLDTPPAPTPGTARPVTPASSNQQQPPRALLPLPVPSAAGRSHDITTTPVKTPRGSEGQEALRSAGDRTPSPGSGSGSAAGGTSGRRQLGGVSSPTAPKSVALKPSAAITHSSPVSTRQLLPTEASAQANVETSCPGNLHSMGWNAFQAAVKPLGLSKSQMSDAWSEYKWTGHMPPQLADAGQPLAGDGRSPRDQEGGIRRWFGDISDKLTARKLNTAVESGSGPSGLPPGRAMIAAVSAATEVAVSSVTEAYAAMEASSVRPRQVASIPHPGLQEPASSRVGEQPIGPKKGAMGRMLGKLKKAFKKGDSRQSQAEPSSSLVSGLASATTATLRRPSAASSPSGSSQPRPTSVPLGYHSSAHEGDASEACSRPMTRGPSTGLFGSPAQPSVSPVHTAAREASPVPPARPAASPLAAARFSPSVGSGSIAELGEEGAAPSRRSSLGRALKALFSSSGAPEKGGIRHQKASAPAGVKGGGQPSGRHKTASSAEVAAGLMMMDPCIAQLPQFDPAARNVAGALRVQAREHIPHFHDR